MKRQQTGKLAERLAGEYMVNEGYSILATNWRCTEGEIDIICRSGEQTIFVEVRAKSSGEFGSPAASITRRKQQKLIAAAERYLSEAENHSPDWRIDFIGVEFSSVGHRLEHIQYAVAGEE